MAEINGTTPEQPTAQPQAQLHMQITPQGVVIAFPVSLALDNDMMKQLVKTYLQAHPELVQEIVKEALAARQQEMLFLQQVKRSRND